MIEMNFILWIKKKKSGSWKFSQIRQQDRDCFKYGKLNSIVKCATNMIGQPMGDRRKPFGMVSETTVKAIQKTIDTYYAEYKNK